MASMFPYFYTPVYSTSTGTLALGDGERNKTTGNENVGCLKKYFFNGPLAHHGNRASPDQPDAVVESAFRRRIQGEYGWIGNLAHDYFEQSLFAHADRMKGLPEAAQQQDLYDALWQRYDREWQQSVHTDTQEFVRFLRTRSSGDTLMVWLQKHATDVLNGHFIKEPADAKRYHRFKSILAESVDFITEHLSSMIEHSPYDTWAVIEGKELQNGDVVHDDSISQLEARARSLKPSFDIDVDGMRVRVFCTIDFAYWLPNEQLVIADLKSGKVKASHLEQTGLYGYYITETRSDISPEQISFRLMYPTAEEPYRSAGFDREKLLYTQERTRERIRSIMSCFVRLDDPQIGSSELLSALVELYPAADARCIWALARYKQTGNWPERLPANCPETIKSVPTKLEVHDFLTQRLSPFEIARGFEHDDVKALAIAEAAFDALKGKSSPLRNEWINAPLLRKFVPSLQLDDFMHSFSVEHIRIALPQFFPATGAQHIPEYCPNCIFNPLCDEGQAAIKELRENK